MSDEKLAGLVTNDKAILAGDRTKMHPIDIAILDQAGGFAVSLMQFLDSNPLDATHVRSPSIPEARERDPGEHDPALYKLTTEMREAMSEMALAKSEGCTAIALRLVSPNTASYIRELRVHRGYSWRLIAFRCYPMMAPVFMTHEHQHWSPSSNQLMGMALCERAAILRGEDYLTHPWN